MKKLISNSHIELIFSSFFLYLLIFLDRFTWVNLELTPKTFFDWTFYYILMFGIFFLIAHIFNSLIKYMYNWFKEYYKTTKNKLVIIIILIILFLSISIRILMLLKHFTHCDDIGVARIMADHSIETPWQRMKFFTFMTYAPFQYLISSGFLNIKYNYELVLIINRIPSFICGVLNVFLIFKVSTKLIKSNKEIYSIILAILLIGISWENIIYSVQAASYSIGVTMILFMIDIYLDFLSSKQNITKYLKLALICIISCYSQYQLFIFVFGLYASLFLIKLIEFIKNKDKELFYTILSGVVTVILSIPILLIIRKYGLLNRGLAWNIGNRGQFILNYSHSGFLKLYDVIVYLLKNIIVCIRTYFVYKTGNILTNLISILIFVISLVGFISNNIKKEKIKYVLFFDITLLMYLVMIFSGKLLLSPSRHNMVLIPIIIVNTMNGLSIIFRKSVKIGKLINIFLIGSITLIFIFSFKNEYNNRKNPVSTKYFSNIIEKYNPVSISSIYNQLFSTDFLNIENYDFYRDSIKTIAKIDDINHNIIVIYDINSKLNQEVVDKVLEQLNNSNIPVEYSDNEKWKVLYKYESDNNTEVEYAYNQFSNFPNNFYCYVIEMELND